MENNAMLSHSNKAPSLFKSYHDDSSDPEFDSIFNECSISSSSSKSSSSSNSLPKTSKKGKINVDKKAVNIPNPKTVSQANDTSSQGLLVTCTNDVVAARTVQLANSDYQGSNDMVVTAIGQPIIIAEELGEVTALSLSSNGQWLALALGCFQIWIIKLTWKSVKQPTANLGRQPKIISAVRHHATLEGHRALIHGLHFLKGNKGNVLKYTYNSQFVTKLVNFSCFLIIK